jgi:hypothetical protein
MDNGPGLTVIPRVLSAGFLTVEINQNTRNVGRRELLSYDACNWLYYVTWQQQLNCTHSQKAVR